MSCTCRMPKHLTNNEKNIETHLAREDSDSNYGHMDATRLDIIIFFVKPNGQMEALIISLVMRVLKNDYKNIDIYIYRKNEGWH